MLDDNFKAPTIKEYKPTKNNSWSFWLANAISLNKMRHATKEEYCEIRAAQTKRKLYSMIGAIK